MEAAVQQSQQYDQDQEELDPDRQTHWRKIINESAFTPSALIQRFNFNESSFYSWLRCDSSPKEENRNKMVNAMKAAMKEKRLPWHPSYGYATPEQIRRLQEIGLGEEYNRIMSQIRKQNEAKGKIK